MVPGLLRDVGDVAHIAALVAPRPLTIVGGVSGGGESLSPLGVFQHCEATRRVYSLHQAISNVHMVDREKFLSGLTKTTP
jgi:hypothetical protein